MVDVETVSITIAAASVVAGVIYTVLQVREQTRMRQTDLIIRLYSTYGSNEFQEALLKVWNVQSKDYEAFVDKYGSWTSDNPVVKAFTTVGIFFEGLGHLLHRKLIDPNLTYDLFGGAALYLAWETMKPIVQGVRKEVDDPTVVMMFEYLYNEMKRKSAEEVA